MKCLWEDKKTSWVPEAQLKEDCPCLVLLWYKSQQFLSGGLKEDDGVHQSGVEATAGDLSEDSDEFTFTFCK